MNMSRESCFRGTRERNGEKEVKSEHSMSIKPVTREMDVVPGNGHVIPACKAQCVGLFVKCTTYGQLRMVLHVCVCPHAVAHSHTSDVLIVAGGLQSERETQRD